MLLYITILIVLIIVFFDYCYCTLWFLVPVLRDCYRCHIFVVFGITIEFSVMSFKLFHFLDVQARSQQLEITTIAFNAIIDSSAAQFNSVQPCRYRETGSVEVRERCSMGFGIALVARDVWASGFGLTGVHFPT